MGPYGASEGPPLWLAATALARQLRSAGWQWHAATKNAPTLFLARSSLMCCTNARRRYRMAAGAKEARDAIGLPTRLSLGESSR